LSATHKSGAAARSSLRKRPRCAYGEKGSGMKGWSTAAILAVLMGMPVLALAQAPMSPVYPTGSQKSAASVPSRKAQSKQTWQEPAPLAEPEKGPAPAPAKPASRDDAAMQAPIATAPIPPQDASPPSAKAEPEKSVPSQHKPEKTAAAAAPKPKAHPRASVRRESRPYYWTYFRYPRYRYTYEAPNRGWSAGQYGPSPYSASGP